MDTTPEPKTRRGRPRKPPVKTVTSLPDGTFIPDTPTSGADLMALHQLPQDAWDGVLLKIKRQIPGTQQFELVAEDTIENYSMMQIAQTFGPGTFMVSIPADPTQRWGPRNNVFRVSPDYARTAGWGAVATRSPVQSVREAATFTDTAAALRGNQQMDALQLAQLMEVLVEKAVSKMQAAQPQQMSGMPTLDTAIGMMGQIRAIEDAAVARWQKLQEGVQAPEPEPEDSWAGVVKMALPMVLQSLSPVLARIAPPIPNPQPEPTGAPMEESTMPNIPERDMEILAGPIAMLKPFAPMILQMLGKAPVDKVASDLVAYVPPAMRPALSRLAGIVATDGPAILQAIHPGLATAAGGALLAALAAEIENVSQ